MKRIPFITLILAGLVLASCTKKLPDYAISIPDDAIAVISMHPMQIHTKGQLNTLEALKEKAKDEVWSQILEDPLSTGLMLDAYLYLFATMEEEAPVIGMVCGVKDMEKWETTLSRIDEEIIPKATEMEGYKYIRPDDEGIVAWNENQAIILGSPEGDGFEETFWTATLDTMFHPVKEKSIVSLVDFKDFQGKMKDINIWLSTGDLQDILKMIAEAKGVGDKMGEFPINLANNYHHTYFDFAKGVLNISGETNFSEDVQKNLDEVLVMNPSLNRDILGMAPGEDLLLAIAVSMDLEKVQELVKKYAPGDLGKVGDKVEEATGIPADKLLQALTGDFTLAVNGLEGEAMIPVEIFIGLGVNTDEIEKQLMETVKEMVPVEEEGDFFTINVQGNEIYSGILHDTWVLTNMKGYKEAAKSGKLDHSLLDPPFAAFSEGSMGMYVNLDLQSYPEMIHGLLDQKPVQKQWIERTTGPFEYLGITAGDQQRHMILKTNKPDENSLYTIMKLTDPED
jgi:hypothetical protein